MLKLLLTQPKELNNYSLKLKIMTIKEMLRNLKN